MNIKIETQKDDSIAFIDIVNRILDLVIFQYAIDEIMTIKINNWFDHKWLNYSGKTVVYFKKVSDDERQAALQAEWREKVTVPPFNPNRVLSEIYFRIRVVDNPRFEQVVHRKQWSNKNIHNRILDLTQNGLYIWYSSDTKKNKKGCIMVYRVQDQEVNSWYASLESDYEWQITRTKGIGLNELRAYLK